jgi:hypothetical protein
MALPSILRNHKPSADEQAAELAARDASARTVPYADLVRTVNALTAEVAKLTRQVTELRTAPVAPTVSTVGPVPASPADAESPRALYRLIAVRLGKNEDTVRQSIARGAAFADLREKCPDLAQNMPILRWVADGDRYSRIMAGASMADLVAGR